MCFMNQQLCYSRQNKNFSIKFFHLSIRLDVCLDYKTQHLENVRLQGSSFTIKYYNQNRCLPHVHFEKNIRFRAFQLQFNTKSLPIQINFLYFTHLNIKQTKIRYSSPKRININRVSREIYPIQGYPRTLDSGA